MDAAPSEARETKSRSETSALAYVGAFSAPDSTAAKKASSGAQVTEQAATQSEAHLESKRSGGALTNRPVGVAPKDASSTGSYTVDGSGKGLAPLGPRFAGKPTSESSPLEQNKQAGPKGQLRESKNRNLHSASAQDGLSGLPTAKESCNPEGSPPHGFEGRSEGRASLTVAAKRSEKDAKETGTQKLPGRKQEIECLAKQEAKLSGMENTATAHKTAAAPPRESKGGPPTSTALSAAASGASHSRQEDQPAATASKQLAPKAAQARNFREGKDAHSVSDDEEAVETVQIKKPIPAHERPSKREPSFPSPPLRSAIRRES
ncbi:hypothetical protein cyc_08099 [Cyclospora cayetanensis]|uniref:Uncharacterized protein n=1 Tax=Cyclospora cayetanensis TaxID=88456 RepID=A0A1D3CRK0_9EIME|nr:hypothetical protein cyc_08099 [Cyclospora cayetanensis]